MFAKFTLLLALVAFVALGRSVNGDHNHHHDHGSSSSEEHHHGGGDDKHNHGKGQHHKHDHSQHGEGPYGGNVDVKIKPTAPFAKTKNLTEELYTEIFVIASGDNYASPELPDDVHITARAVVLASQKLQSITKVYPVLFNLTANYALKEVKVEDTQTMIDLINDLAAHVKDKYPDFEIVKNGSFIARGKYFKSGATSQEKSAAYDKWLYDPLIGAASMNKLFYRAILKNDKPQYRILEAMVEHAHHAHHKEKLEKIYADVTAKTVEKVCPSHEPRKAALIFYQHLIDQLAEDPSLLVSLYGENMASIINKPF